VSVFNMDGSLRARLGAEGSGPAQLKLPRGLRLTRDGVNVVVVDSGNDRLALFTTEGVFMKTFGEGQVCLHASLFSSVSPCRLSLSLSRRKSAHCLEQAVCARYVSWSIAGSALSYGCAGERCG
jgi:hypothetical protein